MTRHAQILYFERQLNCGVSEFGILCLEVTQALHVDRAIRAKIEAVPNGVRRFPHIRN
jgi:hypothetical protein